MDFRICCNVPEPLEDRFLWFEDNLPPGRRILDLLPLLRAHPCPLTVYALSSMDRLCLVSQDDATTPWWVLVEPSEDRSCLIVHTMLPVNTEGEDEVRTYSAEEAADAVVEAIHRSRGWDNDVEGFPGLLEIIRRELHYCEELKLREACQRWLRGPIDVCALTVSARGELRRAALLGWTSTHEALVYLPEAGPWGLARLEGGRLSAASEENWYYSLTEAFADSLAWSGGLAETELDENRLPRCDSEAAPLRRHNKNAQPKAQPEVGG